MRKQVQYAAPHTPTKDDENAIEEHMNEVQE